MILKYIREDTSLISIMHAHNEIGVIQPIKEIGNLCNENQILFHVDAAQSAGKIFIDINEMNIDLLSISSHKMYGPKGVGALCIRRKNPKINIKPIFHGGGHQDDIRPGTLAVPIIVGFGKACDISNDTMKKESKKLLKMRNHLLSGVKNNIDNFIINGDLEKRLPGNLNISFVNNSSEQIIMKLRDIAVSNGSACTSESSEPSHVLKAIGRNNNLSRSSIRFGIGRFNTIKEINYTINKLKKILN